MKFFFKRHVNRIKTDIFVQIGSILVNPLWIVWHDIDWFLNGTHLNCTLLHSQEYLNYLNFSYYTLIHWFIIFIIEFTFFFQNLFIFQHWILFIQAHNVQSKYFQLCCNFELTFNFNYIVANRFADISTFEKAKKKITQNK